MTRTQQSGQLGEKTAKVDGSEERLSTKKPRSKQPAPDCRDDGGERKKRAVHSTSDGKRSENEAQLDTNQSGLTDDEFVEGVITAVQSEDIDFLVQNDFCIRPHLVKRIPRADQLVLLLSRNLGTEHRLKAIRLIRTLLGTVELKNPAGVLSSLRGCVVDYAKLFYLKGKVEFIKHRLACTKIEPEHIVKE